MERTKSQRVFDVLGIILLIIFTFLPFTILLILKLNVYHGISWFWVWFGLWGNIIVEIMAWFIIAIIVIERVVAKQKDLY